MSEQQKRNTINNIVGAMSGISGPKREAIILRQLCYWFRADISLGLAIAQGLGVSMETVSNAMPQAQPA